MSQHVTGFQLKHLTFTVFFCFLNLLNIIKLITEIASFQALVLLRKRKDVDYS